MQQSRPTTALTVTRMPRMQGSPPIWSGSTVMRSNPRVSKVGGRAGTRSAIASYDRAVRVACPFVPLEPVPVACPS